MGMRIKWLGAAGFQFKTRHSVFLVDPFVPGRRGPGFPPGRVDHIFVSHGHFDHLSQVPGIIPASRAMVHCSEQAADILKRKGVPRARIAPVRQDKESLTVDNVRVTAYYSSHVRFDLKLILSSLSRIQTRIFGYLPLFRQYPCGRVLAWLFTADGKRVLFFGSAGATPRELAVYSNLGIDLLLMPFQGHTRINEIALEQVRAIHPGRVILHHFDDSFPPLSRAVPVSTFIQSLKKSHPEIGVALPRPGTPFQI